MKNRKGGGEGRVWSVTKGESAPSQAGGASPVLQGEVLGHQVCNMLLATSKASAWSTRLEYVVIGPINSEGTDRYFKQENSEDMGEQGETETNFWQIYIKHIRG